MKKSLFGLLALVAVSGCMNIKFVTARAWVGGDTLYVAYTDYNKVIFSSTYDAKVLKCLRAQNNAMACSPEEQINKLLNEGSWTSSK